MTDTPNNRLALIDDEIAATIIDPHGPDLESSILWADRLAALCELKRVAEGRPIPPSRTLIQIAPGKYIDAADA